MSTLYVTVRVRSRVRVRVRVSFIVDSLWRVRVSVGVRVSFIVDSLWTMWTRRRLEAHVYHVCRALNVSRTLASV